MSYPNTIEQNGMTLGRISHLRIRRGAEKAEVIFELDNQAAKAVDTSLPSTLIDAAGRRHKVQLFKVFFSEWAFRANGTVIETKEAEDEKSD